MKKFKVEVCVQSCDMPEKRFWIDALVLYARSFAAVTELATDPLYLEAICGFDVKVEAMEIDLIGEA